MKKQSQKTVVITGGGKGIGASISQRFLEDDYCVVVGSRSSSSFIKKNKENVHFCTADVSKQKDHEKLIAKAKSLTGRVDAYINCAGFSGWKTLGDIDSKFWDEMIDVNLKGTMWGCKVASQAMKSGGSIINISSLAGKRGSANNSVYCASKFGVTGLTQALAKELGSKKIRVNAVCPVYIESDGLMQALRTKVSPTKGENIEKYLKKFAKEHTALGVLPTGEEVANTCLFLASQSASAITGQSINVDCGVLPQ